MGLVKETHYTKQVETNVHVIDSVMGSGKTSWSIQHMNEANDDKNFLYITPFLDETKRVKDNVTTRNFVTPKHTGKGKMNNLKKLIIQEKNIASTHALFTDADEELIGLLKAGNYTLILDEAMNVLEQLSLKEHDLPLLQKNNMISIDENTYVVNWNEDTEYQDTKYDEIKNLALSGNLYFFENTVLFWTFPISVFQAFEDVYIMTYLFQCQQQRYYYDLYKVDYSYKAVQKVNDRYVLVKHENKEPYDKTLLKSLINLYEGKLNNIGELDYSLSKSWFRKNNNVHLVEKLKKNIFTYFKNNAQTPSIFNMWTCYNDDKDRLVGNGYKGVKHEKGKPYKEKECFVACNARATNVLKHKESLAYLINRFMNPYEKKFFQKNDIAVNEDMYALSELIQWIWRSRIREGKEINLYIPSKRMRTILQDYLESDL